MSRNITPGNKRLDIEERAELVWKHRRSGGTINIELARDLANKGFTTPVGFPLDVETLRQDYEKYVRHQVIFNKETHQTVGVVQLMRLERNLEVLDNYFDALDVKPEVDLSDTSNIPTIAPSQIYAITSLAKEIRATVAEISKLMGVNAPEKTELLVTQRLETDVDQIVDILRGGLEPAIFELVAACLAKGVGLAREREQMIDDGMSIPGYVLVESTEE